MYHRIRDLREDHDFSQTKLARVLNCSQQAYSDYELGKRTLRPEALIALAQLYHTSVDYLLELTDEIKPYPEG